MSSSPSVAAVAPNGSALVFASDRSRSKGLLWGVILMVVAESVALHAFVYARSPMASIALLIANALTIWWIWREFTAPSPVMVGDEDVHVRFGRSVSIAIPLASIREAYVPDWKSLPADVTPHYLKLVQGDDPNVVLQLDPPAAARLTMGIRKRVAVLGLRLDDPKGFVDAVRGRLA